MFDQKTLVNTKNSLGFHLQQRVTADAQLSLDFAYASENPTSIAKANELQAILWSLPGPTEEEFQKWLEVQLKASKEVPKHLRDRRKWIYD
ncbi:hypothetical protein MRS44_018226 [Fusarium solani]|uniref:uncharacterized protein n=1 Tax=Fusarium solani TaxID=169388 RepID=UPI0032C3ED0E|nr:hypothetical protein MRS44_018226 [Fusarium solani]